MANKGVVVSRKWILNLPIRLNPIAHDRVATSLGNGLFVTTLSTHCWTVSYLYQSYDFPRQTQCKEVSLKGAQPQKGLIGMGSMDIHTLHLGIFNLADIDAPSLSYSRCWTGHSYHWWWCNREFWKTEAVTLAYWWVPSESSCFVDRHSIDQHQNGVLSVWSAEAYLPKSTAVKSFCSPTPMACYGHNAEELLPVPVLNPVLLVDRQSTPRTIGNDSHCHACCTHP